MEAAIGVHVRDRVAAAAVMAPMPAASVALAGVPLGAAIGVHVRDRVAAVAAERTVAPAALPVAPPVAGAVVPAGLVPVRDWAAVVPAAVPAVAKPQPAVPLPASAMALGGLMAVA